MSPIEKLEQELIEVLEASTKRMMDRMTPAKRAQAEVNIQAFKAAGGYDFMQDVAKSHYQIYSGVAHGTANYLAGNGIQILHNATEVAQFLQDNPQLLHEAGKFFAKQIANQLDKRYGLTFPIDDLYDDAIMERLDEWVCSIINAKLSEVLRREVTLITRAIPVSEAFKEVDAFIADELNVILGTNFTSFFTEITNRQTTPTTITNQLRDWLNTNVIDAYAQQMKTKMDTYRTFGVTGMTPEAAYAQAFNLMGLDLFKIKLFSRSSSRRFKDTKKKTKNRTKSKAYRARTSKLVFNSRDGENSTWLMDMAAQYKIKNENLIAKKKAWISANNKLIAFYSKNGQVPAFYTGNKLVQYNQLMAAYAAAESAYNAAKF